MDANANGEPEKFANIGESLSHNIVDNVKINMIKEIPIDRLNEILLDKSKMKELQPLIANVVKQASSIEGLRDDIIKLFKNKGNEDLADALEKLQNKLLLLASKEIIDLKGGKRRKSKKRNYYKKRRTSKYR
jgi:hypothetical protein